MFEQKMYILCLDVHDEIFDALSSQFFESLSVIIVFLELTYYNPSVANDGIF